MGAEKEEGKEEWQWGGGRRRQIGTEEEGVVDLEREIEDKRIGGRHKK